MLSGQPALFKVKSTSRKYKIIMEKSIFGPGVALGKGGNREFTGEASQTNPKRLRNSLLI
jgi:hypothetical protein